MGTLMIALAPRSRKKNSFVVGVLDKKGID